MLAAARKHKRVVQVGTQRRSTPHLIDARNRVIKEGLLGQVGLVEIYCYYHMRDPREPAGHGAAREPRLRDVDRAGTDAAVQQAGPPAQLAGLHGVRQRHRRRHVHPHARHGALDARPRLADAGRRPPAASWWRRRARPTSATRRRRPSTSAPCRWSGRIAPMATRPTRSTRGARPSTATRARSRPSVMGCDFTPREGGGALREAVTYEYEQFPEDQTEKDLERHVAPAIRGHMKDLLACIDERAPAGGRHRAGPHVDDGLHPGQPLHAVASITHLGPRRRPHRQRRPGQPAAGPPLPGALHAPGSAARLSRGRGGRDCTLTTAGVMAR